MKNEITVNGKDYVLKTSRLNKRESVTKNKYVIARTYSAGVFAGHLKSMKGKEIVLNDARRVWYWDGAASLSQLAMEGTNKPDKCKFPCEVDEVILTEVIEVIPCTKEAMESIKAVPEWRQ